MEDTTQEESHPILDAPSDFIRSQGPPQTLPNHDVCQFRPVQESPGVRPTVSLVV